MHRCHGHTQRRGHERHGGGGGLLLLLFLLLLLLLLLLGLGLPVGGLLRVLLTVMGMPMMMPTPMLLLMPMPMLMPMLMRPEGGQKKQAKLSVMDSWLQAKGKRSAPPSHRVSACLCFGPWKSPPPHRMHCFGKAFFFNICYLRFNGCATSH